MTASAKPEIKVIPANDAFNGAVDNLWDDPVVLQQRQQAIQVMAQNLCFLLISPYQCAVKYYQRTPDVFEKYAALGGKSIIESAIDLVDSKSNLSAQGFLGAVRENLKSANHHPL